MFTSLSLVGLASVSARDLASDPQWGQFQQFIEQFGRTYASDSEVTGRFEIFKDNLKLIKQRNTQGTAKHGVNRFTDLSHEEFAARYLRRQQTTLNLTKREIPSSKRRATESVDWCAKGHCTPVKDQGQCGSCWAFGGVEMLESDYSIRFGTLLELSTQEVTSCDTNDGGCAGGNAVNAWAFANSTGGIVAASVYPYTSGTTRQTGTCQQSVVQKEPHLVAACESFWLSLGASDEGNMLDDIPLTPMSVAVAADYWQTYESGVITASDGCGPSAQYPIDHNVQVTGYNAAENYYIVRNSWGTGWGQAGFIYIEAGANVCGIAEEAAAVVTCPGTGVAETVV